MATLAPNFAESVPTVQAEVQTRPNLEVRNITFAPQELISGVFIETEDQQGFMRALQEINDCDNNPIKIGGRTLRTALGCTVDEFGNISTEQYTPAQEELLGPYLISILRRNPDERMKAADLDLYTQNVDPIKIVEALQKNGIQAEIRTATGGIWIVVAKGTGGEATFVDISTSWQNTNEALWPKFAVKANYSSENGGCFKIDLNNGSLYEYQLVTRITRASGYGEPRRLSALSRALLWSLTAKDPDGNWLKPPDPETQNLICETVFRVWKSLPEMTSPDYEDSINIRGSLRDFALSMRILLLEDWSKANLPKKNIEFIERLLIAWPRTRKYEKYSRFPSYLSIGNLGTRRH